jgi:hypothetical protein
MAFLSGLPSAALVTLEMSMTLMLGVAATAAFTVPDWGFAAEIT